MDDTMSTDQAEKTNECAQEVVLLIHGTFAESNDSEGNGWWQQGSVFWDDLNQKLAPFGKACVEVFHWSGLNSERARHEASSLLLLKLASFEGEKKKYHLVGHSHGGTIIWLALKKAASLDRVASLMGLAKGASDRPLKGLQSWSTIGTPFMIYGPISLFKRLWLSILFFALSLVPVLIRVVAGEWPPLIISWLIRMCAWTGFLVVVIGDPLVWLIERTSVRRAMAQFGHCWLGLWSREDEAIYGLRNSLNLHAETPPSKPAYDPPPTIRSILRNIFPAFSYLDPTLLAMQLIEFVLRTIFSPLLDLFVVPATYFGNRIMWSTIQARVQGSDLVLRNCRDIQPTPVPDCGCPLELSLDEELIESANEHAAILVPKFRRYLGQAALQPLGIHKFIGGISGDFTGAELVHNSYYNHPAIRDLVATHIAESGVDIAPSTVSLLQPVLRQWYEGFRDSVRSATRSGGLQGGVSTDRVNDSPTSRLSGR